MQTYIKSLSVMPIRTKHLYYDFFRCQRVTSLFQVLVSSNPTLVLDVDIFVLFTSVPKIIMAVPFSDTGACGLDCSL